MSESLRIGKRVFATAVAAATILWSVGLASFVAPLSASAESHAGHPGDVVRGTTLSTLYYYSSDGNRYAFPNEKTYLTWYSDFSGVVTMSDSELAAIPLAGNIVYRPGARWIKIQSDPKTYAVTPEGVIRWIETEEVAQGLAGDSWNTFIDDVADVFFVDYTVGPSLTSASAGYEGALVEGSTYLIWDGEKRLVTDAGFSANRFQSRHILSGSGVDLDAMTAGAELAAKEAALVDPSQKGGVTETTGGLSVSIASDTPASATVPTSAASVPVTKFKMTASSGTATLNQLIAHLGGVGATGNISNVYLYEGNTRLTDSRSINSQTREATFSALGIDFSSGQSRYLTVRMDVASSPGAGDTASFGLKNAAKVVSTAAVSGTFPMYGNSMTFGNVAAGTVTVDKGGSISNPTIGEDDAIIGRFSLEANSEDATMQSLTLNIDDAKDHSDFKLWKGSTMVATGSYIGNDLVQFDFSNFVIEEGRTEQMKVSADVGGQSGDNIKVAVETSADVLALGSDFGFNLGATISDYDETGGNCAATTDECTFSTIQGGELTFAFNGPVANDIEIDSNDEVLMNFSLTAEEWTEIKQIDVIVACSSGTGCDNASDAGGLLTTSAANYTDVTLRLEDGSVWMGPVELDTTNAGASNADDVTQTLNFTDNQIMQAGESLDLMITFDVENTAVASTVLSATIDISGTDAEDANGDTLSTSSDIVPTADIVGNNFTTQAASITYNVSAPPSSGTYVKGATGVDVVGFNFTAGNGGDVTLTDLTQDVVGDSDGTFGEDDIDESDHISSCSLYDAESGALVDGPEGVEATNDEVLFENFSWTVPAGETKKLITRCNFANVALDATDAGNDLYVFDIDAVGDVTAEDEDGSDVTATEGSDNSTPTTGITIAASGTLTIEADGSTPKATIMLGASTGLEVARFKMSASNENFIVKDLTFRNCIATSADTDDDCSAGDGETAGNDEAVSVATVQYENEAGETKTKTGFLSANQVDFDELAMFVDTTNTSVLKVFVDTNAVTDGGADSGDQFQLNLSTVDGVVAQFEAIGVSSSSSLGTSDDDSYYLAKAMTLRKTKPTISLASGSPSGASVPGLSEVLRFNVAADSRGFVTLDQVIFKVTSTDNDTSTWNQCDTGELAAASKWEFYDAVDPSEKLDDDTDWVFTQSDGTVCDGDTETLIYAQLDLEGSSTTPAEEIGAGETKTYVLRVDTTGASSASDDTFRVDIPDQTEIDGVANLLASEGAIRWDDDNEGNNIDGDLVKNLPITGGTMVY